jgi:hypothetical protein
MLPRRYVAVPVDMFAALGPVTLGASVNTLDMVVALSLSRQTKRALLLHLPACVCLGVFRLRAASRCHVPADCVTAHTPWGGDTVCGRLRRVARARNTAAAVAADAA